MQKQRIVNASKNAAYMFIMSLIHFRFDTQGKQQLI
jgi:hypothetical protein